MSAVGEVFWCAYCRQHTSPDIERERLAVCSKCGETYQCGECGFEIDVRGNCLRAEAGAGTCPSGTR